MAASSPKIVPICGSDEARFGSSLKSTELSVCKNGTARNYSTGMPMREPFLILLTTALGGFVGYHAVSAMRSGVAKARGIQYRRARHPRRFWFIVTLQIVFTMLCFYFLLLQVLGV